MSHPLVGKNVVWKFLTCHGRGYISWGVFLTDKLKSEFQIKGDEGGGWGQHSFYSSENNQNISLSNL